MFLQLRGGVSGVCEGVGSLFVHLGGFVQVRFDQDCATSLRKTCSFAIHGFNRRFGLPSIHFPISGSALGTGSLPRMFSYVISCVRRRKRSGVTFEYGVMYVRVRSELGDRCGVSSVIASNSYQLGKGGV